LETYHATRQRGRAGGADRRLQTEERGVTEGMYRMAAGG
jgi:hypothetical protein